jgi:hypothetical protein
MTFLLARISFASLGGRKVPKGLNLEQFGEAYAELFETAQGGVICVC